SGARHPGLGGPEPQSVVGRAACRPARDPIPLRLPMAMSVSPGKSDAVAAEAPGVMGLRDAVLVEHDGAVATRAVLHQMASDPHRPADPALLFRLSKHAREFLRLTVHGQDTVAINHDASLL